MLISVAGFVVTTALFVLLVDREINRVRAPAVGGPHRPTFAGITVSLRAELLLWVAVAVLMVPRVIELLT